MLLLALSAVVVAVLVVFAVRRRAPSAPVPRSSGTRENKPGSDDPSAAIDAFWAWWRTASHDVAKAIAERRADELAESISAHVDAIHPGLEWELGEGRTSKHHLAVSSAGNSELRVLTERWLSRAPPPDATWEYYPARQVEPSDGMVLGIDGVDLDFASYRVACDVDEDRERIHVKVHHPALAKLPEKRQGTAVFLFLDNTLGEDGVEKWLGGIEPSVEPVENGLERRAFVALVDGLAARATGDKWAILKGKAKSGDTIFVSTNLALKRVDHLLMDQHLEVRIALDGLPTDEAAAALNAEEDTLKERLGHDAVWIGRETEPRERRIHLHVAAHGPAQARVREWADEHPSRRIELHETHDPSWKILRRWK